jgi:MFS-type transporter involved in bile tolerance (Atg22 family)
LFRVVVCMQVPMAICGVWWALCMIPALKWLKVRPGPDLPKGSSYLRESWRSTTETFRDVFSLPVSAWYLLWWMVGADGGWADVQCALHFALLGAHTHTVLALSGKPTAIFLIGNIGGLYANSEIRWGCFPKALGLLALFLLAPLCGIGGNYFYLWVYRRFGYSTKSMLITSMVMVRARAVYPLTQFFHCTILLGRALITSLFLPLAGATRPTLCTDRIRVQHDRRATAMGACGCRELVRVPLRGVSCVCKINVFVIGTCGEYNSRCYSFSLKFPVAQHVMDRFVNAREKKVASSPCMS